MNNSLVKTLSFAATLAALSPTYAAFTPDFTNGGGQTATTTQTTITLTNGVASVSQQPTNGLATISVTGDFGSLNGTIVFDVSGYGADDVDTDGINFATDGSNATWEAGVASNIVTNDSGWGISDGSGNGNIGGSDEGIFFTLTISGFDPVAENFGITDYSVANNQTAIDNMRFVEVTSGGAGVAGSGTIVGNGAGSDLTLAVSSGSSFMMSNVATGAGRMQNFTFGVIPEPSTYALMAGVAALGLVALRRHRK